MNLKSMLDLTGRVALITGGSRGLGLQMAEALGEMGATVAITARKMKGLEEALAHLDKLGIKVTAFPCDLSKPELIPAMVQQVVERHGKIDILVNNAGSSWSASAVEYPLEGWQKMMDMNLTSPFVVTQEVARRSMIPNRYGKIINIASIAGLRGGYFRYIGYSTSKAGLINFTRALASEWGEHNITVNAIAPGTFAAGMMVGRVDQVRDVVVARTPLGRLGDDDDLKGLTVLLASEASRYITGQIIAVDGGNSVT